MPFPGDGRRFFTGLYDVPRDMTDHPDIKRGIACVSSPRHVYVFLV